MRMRKTLITIVAIIVWSTIYPAAVHAQSPFAASTTQVTSTASTALTVGCAVGTTTGCTGGVVIGQATIANGIALNGATMPTEGIAMASGVPSSTSFVLYNNSGTLTWNGVALATGSSVSGTTNTIPIFTASNAIGDSAITASGSTYTMTGTWNVTTAIQLNGASINTGGTLTNVAYLDQAQTFSNASGQRFAAGIGVSNAVPSTQGIAIASAVPGSVLTNLFNNSNILTWQGASASNLGFQLGSGAAGNNTAVMTFAPSNSATNWQIGVNVTASSVTWTPSTLGGGTTFTTPAMTLTGAGGLTTATLDTGQGANELYDMDQNVLTTSSPTFAAGTYTWITGTGTLTAGATGAGFTVALDTSTFTGTLAAAQGGTNIDTSASTGVTQVSAGTWSVSTTLQSAVQDNITRTGSVTIGTWASTVNAPNTGLAAYDTGANHLLTLKPGTDFSAHRTLTLAQTDGDVTLTINGNATLNDWFDQSVKTTAAVTHATLDTGQGANELYDMDQNVLTTSSPTFADLTIGSLAMPTTATSGYAAYADATNSLAFSSVLQINSGGYVGLNIAPVAGRAFYAQDTDGNHNQFVMESIRAAASGTTFYFNKARGASTDANNGDPVGELGTQIYSSGYKTTGSIYAIVDGTFTTGDRPPMAWIFSTNTAGGTVTDRMKIHDSGGVSIGDTTDPGATNFRVAGTSALVGNVTLSGVVLASDGNATNPSYSWSGDTNTGIYNNTSGGGNVIYFTINGTDRVSFSAGGIGVTGGVTPTTGFNMVTWPTTASAANLWAADGTGNNIAISTSVISAKQDIHAISVPDARRAVMSLRPVTYRSALPNDDQTRVWPGFIADWMESDVPALATYSGGKLTGVAYERVSAYLVPLAQDHDRRIAELERELATLKARAH